MTESSIHRAESDAVLPPLHGGYKPRPSSSRVRTEGPLPTPPRGAGAGSPLRQQAEASLRSAIEALDAQWCESISHGTERGEPWVQWLTARVRELREALGATECGSCGESPNNECPKSKRPCGHHCNHVWEQDICHWCGVEFGEEADVALPPGQPTATTAEPTS